MKKFFVLLACLFLAHFSFSQFSIVNDTTVFPLNEYLYIPSGAIYPDVRPTFSVDTTGFLNVMDFGAAGNGITVDDNAIRNAFNAAIAQHKGLIFPAGHTFISSQLLDINLTGDITVYAVGATIKKANFSRYSFVDFDPGTAPFTWSHEVIWYGGTLDGNRANQDYPQASNNFDSTKWEEAHGGLLTVRHTAFTMAYDVNVVNSVTDGIVFNGCKLGIFAKDTAINGAPIKFSEVQQQETYFKNTRQGMKATYFFDVYCDGGSIAMQPSWPETVKPIDTQTLTVMSNVRVWNTRQDGIHIEDCYKNFLFNVTVGSDNDTFYHPSVHVSNETGIFVADSCHFTNGKVNFNQAQNLKIGLVNRCDFASSASYDVLVDNASHFVNSVVSGHGTGSTEVTHAKYLKNTIIDSFANHTGCIGVAVAWNSGFSNGSVTPMSMQNGGVRVGCTYTNCPSMTNSNPADTSYRNPFQDSIRIQSEVGDLIGVIKCDGSQYSNIPYRFLQFFWRH